MPEVKQFLKKVKGKHTKKQETVLAQRLGSNLRNRSGIDSSNVLQYSSVIQEFSNGPVIQEELSKLIHNPTVGEKAEHLALAGIFGGGVGGAAFLANNLTGGAAIPGASAVFSTALGIAASTFFYKVWLRSAQGDEAVTLNEFQKRLKDQGFTEDKFKDLSEKLEKLLLSTQFLFDQKREEIIKEIKKKTKKEPNDLELMAAIEYNFLLELNKLLDSALPLIYKGVEDKIQGEQMPIFGPLVRWMHRIFQNPKVRENFSQQLQVSFLEQVLIEINKKMNEPTLRAQYPKLTTAAVFVSSCLIALTVASLVIGGPLTLGIIGACIAAAAVAACASYYVHKKKDFFHYKASAANRVVLQNMIDEINGEIQDINVSMMQIKKTEEVDLKDIQKIREAGITLGASRSWIREYDTRYEHSPAIEVDLAAAIDDIATDSEKQTKHLQGYLLEYNKSKIDKFVNNTKAFLKTQENQTLVTKYELKEKIRQQILEIVSAVPPQHHLPENLVDLYIAVGGYAEKGIGNTHDLYNVRMIAPFATKQDKNDAKHPYHKMVECAQTLDTILRSANNNDIFVGDSDYRAKLGLEARFGERNEINSDTIQRHLDASYTFLHKLNMYNTAQKMGNGNELITNSNEFILYRMLLIKQLASLTDPNSLMDKEVIDVIKKFAKEKLQIDPEIVFDDVRNQMLFFEEQTDSEKLFGTELSMNNLDYMADAIRVDIAYSSKLMVPNFLIKQEINSFLEKNKRIASPLAYGPHVLPNDNPEYLKNLKLSIQTTKAFIQELDKNSKYVSSGLLKIYINQVRSDIERSLNEIQRIQSRGENLVQAQKILSEYKKELHIELNMIEIQNQSEENPQEEPITQCIAMLDQLIKGNITIPTVVAPNAMFSMFKTDIPNEKMQIAKVKQIAEKIKNFLECDQGGASAAFDAIEWVQDKNDIGCAHLYTLVANILKAPKVENLGQFLLELKKPTEIILTPQL